MARLSSSAVLFAFVGTSCSLTQGVDDLLCNERECAALSSGGADSAGGADSNGGADSAGGTGANGASGGQSGVGGSADGGSVGQGGAGSGGSSSQTGGSGGTGGTGPATDPVALYVCETPPCLDSIDQEPIQTLQDRGFVVQTLGDDAASAVDTIGKDLLVIGPSADGPDIGFRLREVAVPTLVLESSALDEQDMAQRRSSATPPQAMEVTAPSHPIASGAPANFDLCATPATQGGPYAEPAPTATVIVTPAGEPLRAILFAYDVGDDMLSSPAPARRVGSTMFNFGVCESTIRRDLMVSAVAWLVHD